jgi:hypothetical protein
MNEVQPKPPRHTEVFALACWKCGRDIEVPIASLARCPVCAAELAIQWRRKERRAAPSLLGEHYDETSVG